MGKIFDFGILLIGLAMLWLAYTIYGIYTDLGGLLPFNIGNTGISGIHSDFSQACATRNGNLTQNSQNAYCGGLSNFNQSKCAESDLMALNQSCTVLSGGWFCGDTFFQCAYNPNHAPM